MHTKTYFAFFILILLAGCASPPPRDINNVCNIFREYPNWYRASLDVERRWLVPVHVQMAIIHQESKFDAHARPPRTKLLWVIPWSRPSTAYGYSQALNGNYKHTDGSYFASRNDFADGVDFIGWYANQAYKRARINRSDAYNLYLAYHEGIGGFQAKTDLKKAWLIPVAHKVGARSEIYKAQLRACKK